MKLIDLYSKNNFYKKIERGPTSVRLVYWPHGSTRGEFRLDAADHRLIGALPGFKNVVQLVQYYVEENNNGGGKKKVVVKSGNRQVCIIIALT